MASKQEMEATLRKRFGRELLNLADVARAIGKSRDMASRFVSDLDAYHLGSGRKLYCITDIAAKLDREKQPGTFDKKGCPRRRA